MTTFTVYITEKAAADMSAIRDYISNDLGSPETADSLIRRFEQAISLLESFPERFRRYEIEPYRTEGVRVMPVGNYLIFYIPDTAALTVTVFRVVYASRDLPVVLASAPET